MPLDINHMTIKLSPLVSAHTYKAYRFQSVALGVTGWFTHVVSLNLVTDIVDTEYNQTQTHDHNARSATMLTSVVWNQNGHTCYKHCSEQ